MAKSTALRFFFFAVGRVVDGCGLYKAFRSAGGLRRPLRSIRKENFINVPLMCEADRRSVIEYIFFV